MMSIYFPIAGTALNLFLVLGLGGGIGVLSGIFGVGGGFLLTPLLMFIGIPPTVAVASGANVVVASSVSGLIAHLRRANVDLHMGFFLIVGGGIGSGIGVFLSKLLITLGQLDLTISLSYVVLLGSIGTLMFVESTRAMWPRKGRSAPRRLHQHHLLHRLPFKRRFRRSRLYISALLPIGLGIFGGVLTASLGVGGGFVMVPAMIYLIGMPTNITVGTSLLQITLVSAAVTFLQAVSILSVDIILVLSLALGSVVGAQFGARIGTKIQGAQLRFLLALIVIAVCVKVAFGLFQSPGDLFYLVPHLP